MRIISKTGDLLAAPERIVVHGCNAQGMQGSGVAKQLRARYPDAYAAYRDAHTRRGLRLGEVIWHLEPTGPLIGHAITQRHYGRDGTRYVDYDAVRAAMRAVDTMVAAMVHKKVILDALSVVTAVAMPAIGAGLGGGSWDTLAAIIEAESRHFQPVIYLLNGTPPAP